ncbi:SERTA domain-containing protein 3 [Stygiomarasmius scandens]|uniref:SERTA domain-containing protein 3 n=1 Tax=Marasmiellus scandens TaxID=2682957 RepID=A0ABR1INJ9_9AGAR
MPNPGAFKGKWFLWLSSQVASYVDAYRANNHKSHKEEIFRNFFRRFPAKYSDDWEPTDKELSAVKDNAPLQEEEPVSIFELDEEKVEWEEKREQFHKRIQSLKGVSVLHVFVPDFQSKLPHSSLHHRHMTLTCFCLQSIGHWLDYRLRITMNLSNTAKAKGKSKNDKSSPAERLVRFMTGDADSKPRKQPDSKFWAAQCPEAKTAIRKEYDALLCQWREGKIGSKKDKSWPARKYAEVVNVCWDKLSREEQKEWARRAQVAYKAEMTKWEHSGEEEFSTEPKERQRCINAMSGFLQEVVDLAAEACGWEITTIMGGPEPGDNGRINTISIHSGLKKHNFGTVMHSGYRKHLLPLFGEYLKQCYTKAECKARALQPEDTAEIVGLAEYNENLEIFSVRDGSLHEPGSSTVSPSVSTLPVLTPSTSASVAPKSPVPAPASSSSTSTQVSPVPTPLIPDSATPASVPAPTSSSLLSTSETVPTTPESSATVPDSNMVAPVASLPPSLPPSPRQTSPGGCPPPSPRGVEQAVGENDIEPQIDAPSSHTTTARSGRGKSRAGKRKSPNEPSARKKARVEQSTGSTVPTIDDWGVSAVDGSPSFNEVMLELLTLSCSELAGRQLPQPESGPLYLSNCVQMFNSCQESNFRVTCHKWLVFEWKRRLDKNTKIPSSSHRPKAVGDWISRARAVAWRPSIHTETYYIQFEDWYHTVQPEWRDQDDEGKWETPDKSAADWDFCRHSGPNGFVNLLAALFWDHGINGMPNDGFRDQKAKEKMRDHWGYFVSDVSYMLDGLLK